MLPMPSVCGADRGLQSYYVSGILPLSLSATDQGAIRCFCRAEFCYTCGRRWKTCSCAQWDEQRLYDEANRVVDVRHGPGMVEHREARVNEIQAALRELQDCDHPSWRRIGRPGQCQGCEFYFPHFSYACEDCGMIACAACRHHRL